MVMNQQDRIARLREHRAALRALGVYEYAGIEETIANLFEGPIDVVERDRLKPRARAAIVAEARRSR
jgi:predicted nucleotidyltransferase